jgi:SPW repeat
MNTVHQHHLMIATLGIWLVSSPLMLGYTTIDAALINSLMVGIALVVLAKLLMNTPQRWEPVAILAIGGWLIMSPWILGFEGIEAARINALVSGAAVIGSGLAALVFDFKGTAADFRHWWDDIRHHLH